MWGSPCQGLEPPATLAGQAPAARPVELGLWSCLLLDMARGALGMPGVMQHGMTWHGTAVELVRREKEWEGVDGSEQSCWVQPAWAARSSRLVGWLTPGGCPHLGGCTPTWDMARTVGRLWMGGREGGCWAGAVGRGQDRLSPGRGGSSGPLGKEMMLGSPWAVSLSLCVAGPG